MIFILSGPSGSGKTTLRELVLKDRSLKKRFTKSVSLSTRSKRVGERQGKDYFFISERKFRGLRRDKKILEWTKYLGYYYGTKKDYLLSSLKANKNLILCLDFKGAQRVKKLYPKETVSVFIIPPSVKELRKRIEGRSCGTKKEEVLRRLKVAEEELKNVSQYDYALRNTNLVQALKRLKGIILKRIGS
jgi:guanylate kinase